MKNWNINGAVIVSWDLSNGPDNALLLVGKQTNGKVEVINAYQGEEAMDIRAKLLPKEGA